MGIPMFTGVALHKNSLGQTCLISGIYFGWDLLINRRERVVTVLRLYYSTYLLAIPMVVWLFYMANSATSLICMFLAILLFAVGRQPVVTRDPQRILTLGFAFAGLFGLMELLFDVRETVIAMLGRRPDLTDRVPMWHDLLGMVNNPLIGFGYESFWTGERRRLIEDKWGIGNQAHNGYLDVYLNLGIVGLCLLASWFVSGIRKVRAQLPQNYSFAMLRLCFILVALLYNWTEATIHGVSNVFVLILLGVMDVHGQHNGQKSNLSHDAA